MIVVAGAGWVTVAGAGRARAGDPFSFSPGRLPIPERRAVFPDPYTRFGRLDDFSRVGLAAITFALRDAGLEKWEEKRAVGIAAATTFGCLATDADFLATVIPDRGALASPNIFAYTLPNAFLGEAAIRHGLAGPTVALLGDRGAGAIGYAAGALMAGECDAMVAGICDVAPPPPIARPEGFAPGAAFVVLRRGAPGDGCLGALPGEGHDGASAEAIPAEGFPDLVRRIVEGRNRP